MCIVQRCDFLSTGVANRRRSGQHMSAHILVVELMIIFQGLISNAVQPERYQHYLGGVPLAVM
ncbi:hypothetical protein ANAPH2_01468 [Anaplasma phagocytophilum]|nr:hypothetical protein ANAPH2_01468 [Anaplasma phagocytophilum]